MKAGVPPHLHLDGNYIIRFTAVSATTGAVVAGVNVSQASLLVQNLGSVDLQVITPPGEIDWLNLPQDGG